MAYQNYALQAMVEIVDAGRRLGMPLERDPKFLVLLKGPLNYAYPNGQFPAINDSDSINIGSFEWSFRWAQATYPDWPGNPTPPAATQSANLADAGLAVLRRGTGAGAATTMLDYGPHGGGHGHFDKLNIVLFAAGREWLLDPGRLTYSHKEYITWVKETVAHNSVTLGGRSQAPTQGKLLWFDAQDRYAACAARSERAYLGAVLTRYLLSTDKMLVDLFEVESTEPTQIDWVAHAPCESVQPVEDRGQPMPLTLGHRDGYQHLTSARAWQVAGPSSWDFVAGPESRLRVWLAGPEREQIAAAVGIGYTIEAKVPCLLRRVAGRNARFAAVYDLTGKGEYIRAANCATGQGIDCRHCRWSLDDQFWPRESHGRPLSERHNSAIDPCRWPDSATDRHRQRSPSLTVNRLSLG